MGFLDELNDAINEKINRLHDEILIKPADYDSVHVIIEGSGIEEVEFSEDVGLYTVHMKDGSVVTIDIELETAAPTTK